MESELAPKFAPFVGMVRLPAARGPRALVLTAARRRPASPPPWSLGVGAPEPRPAVHALTVAAVAIGAAYGTAKSGIGIAGVGTFRPDLIMKVRPPRGRPTAGSP